MGELLLDESILDCMKTNLDQEIEDCDAKHPHVSSAGSHFAELKFSVSDSHTKDASTTVLKVPTAQNPGSLEWNKADECTIIKLKAELQPTSNFQTIASLLSTTMVNG